MTAQFDLWDAVTQCPGAGVVVRDGEVVGNGVTVVGAGVTVVGAGVVVNEHGL